MLTDDIQHKLGVCPTMLDVRSNEATRQKLQQDYEQWLADGNEVLQVPPNARAKDLSSFNNQGDLNPAKRKKGWSNEGIARSR